MSIVHGDFDRRQRAHCKWPFAEFFSFSPSVYLCFVFCPRFAFQIEMAYSFVILALFSLLKTPQPASQVTQKIDRMQREKGKGKNLR